MFQIKLKPLSITKQKRVYIRLFPDSIGEKKISISFPEGDSEKISLGKFDVLLRNPNIDRLIVNRMGKLIKYSIKIKGRRFDLPFFEGITPPSWYTEIQLNFLVKIINKYHMLVDNNAKFLDVGSGSLIIPMLLALNGVQEITALEPSEDFKSYLKILNEEYGHTSWWKSIRTINKSHEGMRELKNNYFDLIYSNINCEPWPFLESETNENCYQEQKFHDGGFNGTELLEQFIEWSSKLIKSNGFIIFQQPLYVFNPRYGNTIVESVAQLLKINNYVMLRHEIVNYPIIEGSIVGKRPKLYKEKLNWEPVVIDQIPHTQIGVFLARKI